MAAVIFKFRKLIYFSMLGWMIYIIGKNFSINLVYGGLGAVIVGLTLEALWFLYKEKSIKNSSVVQLFQFKKTQEDDLFFWFFYMGGIVSITTGFLAYKLNQKFLLLLNLDLSYQQFFEDHLVLSIIIVFFLSSFMNYYFHRLLHQIPFLWELHKTHHSATKMTGLTQFREHLVIDFIQNILKGIVFSLLGLNIGMLGLYLVFLNVQQALIHSKVDSDWQWLGLIFISPRAHHIHHSVKSMHYNKNFGMDITLWDRLFKTYHVEASKEPIQIGLAPEDDTIFQKDSPILVKMLMCFKNAVSNCVKPQT